MSSIGDIILTSPVVRQLRRNFPEAQIDYLVRKEYAAVIKHNPHLSNVIEFDAKGEDHALQLMRQYIQDAEYDLILDLHRNIRSKYLRRFLNHPRIYKISKNQVPRFLLVNTGLNLYKQLNPYPLSVAAKYLRAGKSVGLDPSDLKLDVYLPEETQKKGEQIWQRLHDEGARVVIAPGARHYTKCWPAAYYARLIELIHQEFGWTSVLVGGPDEAEMAASIENRAGEQIVDSLAGRISLLETFAIIQESLLFISNDSGLMHVAAAYQKPQIAIFGSTTRELGFFPVNENATIVENNSLNCRPCTHIGKSACPREHFKCMLEVTPEEVFSALQQKVIQSGL